MHASLVVAWILLLALTIAALCWRSEAQRNEYAHPDEAIAAAVIGKVTGQGSLDTNWARTDVQSDFRYNQYNFSAYYLIASAAELLTAPPDHDSQSLIRRSRTGNALLGALCVLLSGWLGFRLHGIAAGLAAGLLVSVCPLLFQDSLYARPEPFCTLLVLAFLLVTTGRKKELGPLAMTTAGLLVGVLIATKVTFVMLAPFPLIALAATRGGSPSSAWAVSGYFGAIGAGFAIGAPFALLNPTEYLDGLAYLFHQYGSGHWPHGLHDGRLGERLGYGLSYLHHALGLPALLTASIGLAVLVRHQTMPTAFIVTATLLGAAYFLQSRAFFERNLSHAVAPLLVLSGIGIAWIARHLAPRWKTTIAPAGVILALSTAAPAFLLTLKLDTIALSGHHAAEQAHLQSSLTAHGHLLVDVQANHEQVQRYADVACSDIVIAMDDYGDRYAAARIRDMTTSGRMGVLAYLPGPFHGLPTSTLHTYHARDRWYLHPHTNNRGCTYRLSSLPAPKGLYAPPTVVNLKGGATLDGDYSTSRTQSWPFPRYASWNGSDTHTGEIQMHTPPLCEPFHLPLVTGPAIEGIDLEITAIDEDGSSHGIHQGPPPFPIKAWGAMNITPPSGSCPRYRIVLRDTGQGWGQWAGIGLPVQAPISRPQ